MELTGAQILVETLIEQGVDTVFGYPGGQVLHIYDALYGAKNRLRHILSCHEQGAAHMADGYARSTGRTGVVISTSGPGATNLVTGIATAYLDSVPMVAVTGNVPTHLIGRDSFQEVDITGVTMPITKHNFIVKDISELADTLRRAFVIAESGRPGPVLVDIPKDIQTARHTFFSKAPQQPALLKPKSKALNAAVRLIKQAKRPFIYAGGGVVSAGASALMQFLADKIESPVGTSIMGLTAIPHDHPLFTGMLGMHGQFAASKAISEADVILAMGCRFSDRVTGNKEEFAPGARIVHFDIDDAEIGKNVDCAVGVAGDIRESLSYLLDALPNQPHPRWRQYVETLKSQNPSPEMGNGIHPKALVEAVYKTAGKNAIIATDVGQHQMWTAQYYPFTRPRSFITSGGLGTMGFGMGAAIGAAVGNPDRRVVLFTGDGSFHMNMNELATAVSYGLPVVVIVMNNGALGMVRQWQKLFFHERYSHTTLHRATDYVKLADAMGAAGYRMESPDQIASVLNMAFSAGGPAVIDCRVDIDEMVLPMIPPDGSVNNIILN